MKILWLWHLHEFKNVISEYILTQDLCSKQVVQRYGLSIHLLTKWQPTEQCVTPDLGQFTPQWLPTCTHAQQPPLSVLYNRLFHIAGTS